MNFARTVKGFTGTAIKSAVETLEKGVVKVGYTNKFRNTPLHCFRLNLIYFKALNFQPFSLSHGKNSENLFIYMN